jgi:hypothetical protein
LFEDIDVVGNLLMFDGCDSRVAYAFNVFSTAVRRGRCASTDRVGADAMPYVDASSGQGFNFRLRPKRTVADDLVPRSVPGGCPRVDVDRQRRAGKQCDAGSDERTLR